MRKLRFNNIRSEAKFIESCAGHCPEAVQSHGFLAIAHAPQRGQRRGIADGSSECAGAGEKQFSVAGIGVKLIQQDQHLFGQRHHMLAPHSHARCRNDPCGVFEVKLAPVRKPQFRRASENVGQDFQAIDNGGIADIGINIPQKLANIVRQGNSGEMGCLYRRQSFGQSSGHIVFHAACDAGIARHLSAQAHELVGCFVMAETLRGLNDLQKVGRFKLGDRFPANGRENRIFKIAT